MGLRSELTFGAAQASEASARRKKKPKVLNPKNFISSSPFSRARL
jgi:hypothetical protein